MQTAVEHRGQLQLLQSIRNEEEIMSASQLVERKSESSDAWKELGMMLGSDGRTKVHDDTVNIVDCLLRAIEAALSDAQQADCWEGLGFALGPKGQTSYKDGKVTQQDALTKAVELNNDSAVYWNNLGHSLGPAEFAEVDGRFLNSRECFLHAVQLDGQCGQSWRGLGSLMQPDNVIHVPGYGTVTYRSCLLRADASMDAASFSFVDKESLSESSRCRRRSSVTQLIEDLGQNPEDVDSWFDLGCILSGGRKVQLMGEEMEARDCYVKVIQLIPEDAEAWYSLGVVLKPEEGVEIFPGMEPYGKRRCFVQAIELDDNSVEAWHNLALILDPLEHVTVAGKLCNLEGCLARVRQLEGIHESELSSQYMSVKEEEAPIEGEFVSESLPGIIEEARLRRFEALKEGLRGEEVCKRAEIAVDETINTEEVYINERNDYNDHLGESTASEDMSSQNLRMLAQGDEDPTTPRSPILVKPQQVSMVHPVPAEASTYNHMYRSISPGSTFINVSLRELNNPPQSTDHQDGAKQLHVKLDGDFDNALTDPAVTDELRDALRQGVADTYGNTPENVQVGTFRCESLMFNAKIPSQDEPIVVVVSSMDPMEDIIQYSRDGPVFSHDLPSLSPSTERPYAPPASPATLGHSCSIPNQSNNVLERRCAVPFQVATWFELGVVILDKEAESAPNGMNASECFLASLISDENESSEGWNNLSCALGYNQAVEFDGIIMDRPACIDRALELDKDNLISERNKGRLMKEAQQFSKDDVLVRYIVTTQKWIEDHLSFGYCEMDHQNRAVVFDSDFSDAVFDDSDFYDSDFEDSSLKSSDSSSFSSEPNAETAEPASPVDLLDDDEEEFSELSALENEDFSRDLGSSAEVGDVISTRDGHEDHVSSSSSESDKYSSRSFSSTPSSPVNYRDVDGLQANSIAAKRSPGMELIDNRAGGPPKTSEEWFELGNTLGEDDTTIVHPNKPPMTAAECYMEALRLNPYDSDCWNNLGASLGPGWELCVDGELFTQRDCCRFALNLDPNNDFAKHNLETLDKANKPKNPTHVLDVTSPGKIQLIIPNTPKREMDNHDEGSVYCDDGGPMSKKTQDDQSEHPREFLSETDSLPCSTESTTTHHSTNPSTEEGRELTHLTSTTATISSSSIPFRSPSTSEQERGLTHTSTSSRSLSITDQSTVEQEEKERSIEFSPISGVIQVHMPSHSPVGVQVKLVPMGVRFWKDHARTIHGPSIVSISVNITPEDCAKMAQAEQGGAIIESDSDWTELIHQKPKAALPWLRLAQSSQAMEEGGLILKGYGHLTRLQLVANALVRDDTRIDTWELLAELMEQKEILQINQLTLTRDKCRNVSKNPQCLSDADAHRLHQPIDSL